ncbi:MAG: beta-lactamase family protein, partial [bacterium]|nr:beta-lactamase family protein [bacterium]
VPPGNKPAAKDTLKTVPAEREITIRDLLRHTAGFVYGGRESVLDKMYRDAGFRTWNGTLPGFVKRLAKFPLAFQPGTRWKYCYSTDVLGYFMEVVTGQPLDQFLRQRIFKPLGMEGTGFFVAKDKLNRLPNHYKFEKGSLHLVEPAAKSNFRNPPSALSAGGGWGTGYGGLVTTAPGFARFLQMFLNYGKLGKNRLLSRKTIELMTANHIKGIPGYFGTGGAYGHGIGITTDIGESGELSSPGEVYWAGSPYNAYFFVD